MFLNWLKITFFLAIYIQTSVFYLPFCRKFMPEVLNGKVFFFLAQNSKITKVNLALNWYSFVNVIKLL